MTAAPVIMLNIFFESMMNGSISQPSNKYMQLIKLHLSLPALKFQILLYYGKDAMLGALTVGPKVLLIRHTEKKTKNPPYRSMAGVI